MERKRQQCCRDEISAVHDRSGVPLCWRGEGECAGEGRGSVISAGKGRGIVTALGEGRVSALGRGEGSVTAPGKV